jgi:hypothetical protein
MRALEATNAQVAMLAAQLTVAPRVPALDEDRLVERLTAAVANAAQMATPPAEPDSNLPDMDGLGVDADRYGRIRRRC